VNDDNFARLFATLEVLPPEYGTAGTLRGVEGAATRDYYRMGLRDVPDTIAGPLLLAIVDTCEKRPLVPKIKDLAAQLMAGPRRTAGEAFADLNAEIRRHGRLHVLDGTTPKFDDPALNAVVAAIGWEAICDEDSPASVWRGQFVKLYDAASAGQKQEPLRQLAAQVKREAIEAQARLMIEGGNDASN
jgi:hypothetical protein